MTKAEKVINGMAAHGKPMTCVNNDGKVCPYFSYDDCFQRLMDDAIELLKEQEPRVLTLEEMKSLSTANDDALYDRDMTFVWLEAAADGYINITRPTYSFHPEWGNEDDSFYVYYIGTDVGDRLESCDYGKTWRCWTARPTDKQMEATPWSGLPKEGDKE